GRRRRSAARRRLRESGIPWVGGRADCRSGVRACERCLRVGFPRAGATSVRPRRAHDGATCLADVHAAAVKQTVIAIENAPGMMKTYIQLTTAMAANESAKAHAMPRISDNVAAGSAPSCQANIAEKK